MKERLISAGIILIICIPLLIIGGLAFNLGVFSLSMCALYEFLKIKGENKPIPSFIKFLSYIIMALIILMNLRIKELTFSIDYRVLSALFVLFLIPTILYHDRKKYSVNDAFYLIGGILFLGISLSLLILVRNKSLSLLIYLLLIPVITDTYAFITGKLIGKTKLLEIVSPNKTLEGMIGGTIFGVIVSVVFYHLFVNDNTSIYVLTLISLFLSVLGQLGDLVFSAIKRYFAKKDFSNLIPGHGGILDRLDSIIFVLLGFMFFITII